MKFPLCPAKNRPQRDSNSQSSDSESDTSSVGPCGYVSCQLYLLLVQLPSVVPCIESISKNFFCVKQKVDYKGIRSPNLLLPSHTPYPLGHLAMYPVTCICYLFSCQVLSLVLTPFLRNFLCVQQKSRPQRESDALSVGPCGHVYCPLYLLLVPLQKSSTLDCFFCREISFVTNKKSATEGFEPQCSAHVVFPSSEIPYSYN